jgi:hypothetical protein
MTLVRRLSAMLLAVGLMFGLVACNDNGGSSATGLADQQGPAALTKDNLASSIVAAQAKAGTAHIEATITAAGQPGSISADVKGLGDLNTVAMDMSAKLAGTSMRLLVVDNVLYVKSAALNSDPSKPWLKVSLGDTSNPLSKIFDSANPANFTAYLRGITKFRDEGLQTVDGVQTRHYSVTVDTAKMLAGNPVLKGQDMSSLGLPGQLTSDVYVNSDNLPVKMSVTMGSAASLEAHFSKYGEPVDIQAPPADQVSKFSL